MTIFTQNKPKMLILNGESTFERKFCFERKCVFAGPAGSERCMHFLNKTQFLNQGNVFCESREIN